MQRAVALFLAIMAMLSSAIPGFAGGGGGGPVTIVKPFSLSNRPIDLFHDRVVTYIGRFAPNGQESIIVQTENYVGEGRYRTDTYQLEGIQIEHSTTPEPGTPAQLINPEQGEKLAIVQWEDRNKDGLFDTLVTRQFREATPLERELNGYNDALSEEGRTNGFFLFFHPGNCRMRIDFQPPVPGPYRYTWKAKNGSSSLSVECPDGTYFQQRVYPGHMIAGTGAVISPFWHDPNLLCNALRWGTWQTTGVPGSVSPEAEQICRTFSRYDIGREAWLQRNGFLDLRNLGITFPRVILYVWQGDGGKDMNRLWQWKDVPCADFGQEPCELPSLNPTTGQPFIHLGTAGVQLAWDAPIWTRPVDPNGMSNVYRIVHGPKGGMILQQGQ